MLSFTYGEDWIKYVGEDTNRLFWQNSQWQLNDLAEIDNICWTVVETTLGKNSCIDTWKA